MPSNKPRLYVALFARGGAPKMPGLEVTYFIPNHNFSSLVSIRANPFLNSYHWALLVGPKTERADDRGKRYHAREKIDANGRSEWTYEERDVGMIPSNMQLVRVLVAKIENYGRFERILQSIQIQGEVADWNCVEWVREALEMLESDGKALGTSVVDWKTVRDACMEYVQKRRMSIVLMEGGALIIASLQHTSPKFMFRV
jgi:hypothetical protein